MDRFIYVKGRCLNCDTPIISGILCRNCIPSAPIKTVIAREVRISDMDEGDSGYIEEYAIFEIDGKLYVIGTAYAIQMPDRYKTVHVKVHRGIFEIDRQTIDTDDIYLGWPDFDDRSDCYQAKLI